MKILKVTFITLLFCFTSCAQKTETKTKSKEPDYSNVDFSKKSNIINPDTLKGDQKKIFWHFVKLTHKQAKELKPLKIKEEFAKLGIKTKERDRFVKAYSFFRIKYLGHKKSCQNFAYFDFLKPKYQD